MWEWKANATPVCSGHVTVADYHLSPAFIGLRAKNLWCPAQRSGGQNQRLTKLQHCYITLIHLGETFKGACLPAQAGQWQKRRGERRGGPLWAEHRGWFVWLSPGEAESLTCLFKLLFTWKYMWLDQPGEEQKRRIRLKKNRTELTAIYGQYIELLLDLKVILSG